MIKFTLYLFQIHRDNLLTFDMEEILIYFGKLFSKKEATKMIILRDLPIKEFISFQDFYESI